MIVYNGGSISNLLKHLGKQEIWVTDKVAFAIRYANTQSTGEVNPDTTQELAENAAILTIEANPTYWTNRPENHNTLDVSESCVSDYRILKATIRFSDYQNTLYGSRWTGYQTREQVLTFLQEKGIEVEVL